MTHAFECEKLLKYDLKGKTRRKWANRQNVYSYEKKCPQGVVCPCAGAIYMYIAIIFKHHQLCNRLANESQTLCGASLGRGNENLYNLSWSHDQDGHQQKHLKIFSRTRRPMIFKLGMKHQAMEPYKVCINHDPGMTLIYLTARST